MKEYRWQRREKKKRKQKNGMREDGRSCKLIVEIQRKKYDERKTS